MIVKLLSTFEELLFLEEKLGIKSSNEELTPAFIGDMLTVVNKSSIQLAEVSKSANAIMALRSLTHLLHQFEGKETLNYKMKSLLAEAIDKVLHETSIILMEEFADDEFEYSNQLYELIEAIVSYYCVERRHF